MEISHRLSFYLHLCFLLRHVWISLPPVSWARNVDEGWRSHDEFKPSVSQTSGSIVHICLWMPVGPDSGSLFFVLSQVITCMQCQTWRWRDKHEACAASSHQLEHRPSFQIPSYAGVCTVIHRLSLSNKTWNAPACKVKWTQRRIKLRRLSM